MPTFVAVTHGSTSDLVDVSDSAIARRVLLAGAGLGATGLVLSHAFAAESRPPPFYSEGSQFILLRPRPRAPARTVRTAGDSPIDFTAFVGKTVIVNFWATWCAPCVRELPSLDRLEASLRGGSAIVLPIALDATNSADVATFYAAHGVNHLPIYIDPGRRLGHLGRGGDWLDPFALTALPTTYLIDPHGYVVGYVSGAAVWDSVSAAALITWVATQ